MKSLTLLLIPLLFFMTGCSIDWNDEKTQKNTELEKQVQDDTFKKKQECSSEILSNWHQNENQSFQLVESFYSPINNNCMFIVSTYSDFYKGEDKGLYQIGGNPKYESSGFVNTYHDKFCNMNNGKTCEAFDSEVTYYKGE